MAGSRHTRHLTSGAPVRSALLAGLLLCALPAMGSIPETPDDALRQAVRAAVAEGGSFQDRFDAEVWLADMSARLSRKLPDDRHRLHLLRQIHYEATHARLAPELVLAVIEVESNFNRWAISSAGAQGLMQVMPFWLDEIGRPHDNLFDVNTNLRIGCTILRYYLDMEKGKLGRALARYNGSLGRFEYPDKVFSSLRTRWVRR